MGEIVATLEQVFGAWLEPARIYMSTARTDIVAYDPQSPAPAYVTTRVSLDDVGVGRGVSGNGSR